jgi:hypothetical protein
MEDFTNRPCLNMIRAGECYNLVQRFLPFRFNLQPHVKERPAMFPETPHTIPFRRILSESACDVLVVNSRSG